MLSRFNRLLDGGTETVNPDGSAMITDTILGIQLLVSTFNSSEILVNASLFGIDVTFLFELF